MRSGFGASEKPGIPEDLVLLLLMLMLIVLVQNAAAVLILMLFTHRLLEEDKLLLSLLLLLLIQASQYVYSVHIHLHISILEGLGEARLEGLGRGWMGSARLPRLGCRPEPSILDHVSPPHGLLVLLVKQAPDLLVFYKQVIHIYIYI